MAESIEGLMRRDPVTIAPLETLATAQEVMQHHGIRQLPVVENGVLIGMLSERDLHAHIGYLDRTKVDAAMTEHPITLAPTDTPAQAARILIEHKINAIPIVDAGHVVGIVSRSDLLRLLISIIVEPQGT